jgi:aconitate hydratase
LKLDGSETYGIDGLSNKVKPQQEVTLEIRRIDGSIEKVPLILRIDTAIEVDYYRHGGILPFVLREIVAGG